MEIVEWIFNAASSLTNFEIQKYYQNKPRFNGVYSRDNLTEIRDGAYVINLDEYSDIGKLIGLLCMFIMVMLLILIVLGENIFWKR